MCRYCGGALRRGKVQALHAEPDKAYSVVCASGAHKGAVLRSALVHPCARDERERTGTAAGDEKNGVAPGGHKGSRLRARADRSYICGKREGGGLVRALRARRRAAPRRAGYDRVAGGEVINVFYGGMRETAI